MKTKILAAGIASLFLTACGTPPDLSAVKVELGKSLHRYDIVESLASNGKVIVGGTQSGAALVSSDAGKTWTREALGPVSMIGLTVCPDGSFLGIDFYHKVWTADAQGAGWKAAALEKPRVPLTVTCDGKAQEIGTMIAKIQEGTEQAVREMEAGVRQVTDGVKLAHQAGDSVTAIRGSAERAALVVADISLALNEQTAAAREVARTVETIARSTEDNNATVQKTATLAQQLAGLSEQLASLAGRFRIS